MLEATVPPGAETMKRSSICELEEADGSCGEDHWILSWFPSELRVRVHPRSSAVIRAPSVSTPVLVGTFGHVSTRADHSICDMANQIDEAHDGQWRVRPSAKSGWTTWSKWLHITTLAPWPTSRFRVRSVDVPTTSTHKNIGCSECWVSSMVSTCVCFMLVYIFKHTKRDSMFLGDLEWTSNY